MTFSKKSSLLIFCLVIVVILAYWFIRKNKFVPDPNDVILNAPDHISVSIAGRDLEKPQMIAFDPAGRMLVSETDAGRIVLVENGTKRTVLEGLNKPYGLDFLEEIKTDKTSVAYLYVAETNQVTRYPYDVAKGIVDSTKKRNIAALPADGKNFARSVYFGPNFRKNPIIGGMTKINTLSQVKLYIGVGSSCNVCVEDTWKRAAILESDAAGSFTAEFAGGLRNSIFFAFHPKTKEIWATEQGTEGLPDEINIVRVADQTQEFGARRYGWPFCYGDKISDKTFDPKEIKRIDISKDCSKTESPVIELPAHSAPLGIAFIPESWPAPWKSRLLVAMKNKIVWFDVDENGHVNGSGDFIVMKKAVDLKFGSDGALYISNDDAGVVYRVFPTS